MPPRPDRPGHEELDANADSPAPGGKSLGAAALVACLGAAGPATAARSSPAEVEAVVEEVFKNPELRRGLDSAHSGARALFRQFIDWLWGWLWRILGYLDELRAASPFIFWCIFAVLILVLLALLVHIGWTISMAFRRRPGGAQDPDSRENGDRVRRFRDLQLEARELASRGRLRDAIHLLLLALVALVEERRVLRVALGWTNRETFARLRLRPELAGSLAQFERDVERVWYGTAPVTPGDFRRLDRLLEDVAPHVKTVEASDGARGTAGGEQ